MTLPEPVAVDFIEEELTRFAAVLSSLKSATFGRWKIEFTVPHELKDDVWKCSDEEGLEVLVVVMKRRSPTVRELADTLDRPPDIDVEWANVDGPVSIVVDGRGEPV